MTADLILQNKTEQANSDPAMIEEAKLKVVGKTRSHYEKRVSDVESGLQ